ncbi:MAG: hypothetical protein SLagBPW_42690 [Shewanella algae]
MTSIIDFTDRYKTKSGSVSKPIVSEVLIHSDEYIELFLDV